MLRKKVLYESPLYWGEKMIAIFLPGLWMLQWHHSRDSPWGHLCFRKSHGQRDKWTFAMSCGWVEDAWREILQSSWHSVRFTWSNLCLYSQAWIASQLYFSPKLTVICCQLYSSTCLAVEHNLQRKGEHWYWIYEVSSPFYMLPAGGTADKQSGKHNWSGQKCEFLPIPQWEHGPVLFLWKDRLNILGSVPKHCSYFKSFFPISKMHLKVNPCSAATCTSCQVCCFTIHFQHWTKLFLTSVACKTIQLLAICWKSSALMSTFQFTNLHLTSHFSQHRSTQCYWGKLMHHCVYAPELKEVHLEEYKQL